jgi:superfamily II DNA or RNA helicase
MLAVSDSVTLRDRGSFMRTSPQLSLFPSGTTGDAGLWAERLSRAFSDPARESGFLELAESAVGACPSDAAVLTLAAAAALLDARPERALAFLKRISKRYSATPTDHLLQALALFQEGKRLTARGLLLHHGLAEWPAAVQAFPAGMQRMRWLSRQLDAIMDRAHLLPKKHQSAAAKSKIKPKIKEPASRPQRVSSRSIPPAAVSPAGVSLQPLARIDVDISFATEVDLSPMLQAVARAPEPEGRWWELRQRFTHLGFAQGFDELLCLPHLAGVEPLWHQIETVRKVLKQFRGRVLLADEVGLGKTIEAGMVLKEYALRGMAERVLVLAPASLVGQWREELETKFGLAFATTHDPLSRADPDAFWAQKRIIASIATARRQEHAERLQGGVFDLVIIDEAHHLRDRSSQSWKLVDALNKRFLLLLSATPVQNDLIELYNLMTLLKPGMFRTLKEFRAAYVTPGKPREPANAERLRELMRGAMIRNTRAVVALKLPRRHAVTLKVDGLPGEVEAYANLAAAARRLAAGTGAGRHRLALHHMFGAAGSSPAAAAAAVARFAARHPGDAEWHALAERWAAIETGGKEQALLDLLDRNRDEKKLVFVHSRETLGRLSDLLLRVGVPFARFDGSLSGPQKDAAIADFRDRVAVLLCTESGGEGRNIQFCNTLINFDVPWNPMAIEQRIGRIDRIGQHREVFIFNLVTRGTLEDHLLALLEEKISMFELVVGEVSAILGGLSEERDFPELALDAWLEVTEAGRTEAFDLLARQLDEARSQHEGAKALDAALFGDDFETA